MAGHGARSFSLGLALMATALSSGLAACTTDDPSITLAPDPGPPARPQALHGASPCGTCVAKTCSGTRQACAAEPSCATYLACADACPSIATGDVDPTCEGACARPRDPAGARALDAFTACRTTGDGARCAACGPQKSLYRSPLLNQVCTAPPPPRPAFNICPGDFPEVIGKCFDCSWERCCQTRIACQDSADCSQYRACLGQCGDPNEVNERCGQQYPAGLEPVAPFFACMQIRCLDECSNPGTVLDPCVACVFRRCADEQATLASTNEGVQLRKCYAKCNGVSTCTDACDAKHPSAQKASIELFLCVDARCSFDCGGG